MVGVKLYEVLLATASSSEKNCTTYTPPLTTGELTVLTGGAYVVQFFSLDDDVGVNTSYNFTPTLNGVPQSITAGINPSNQTDRVPVSLASIVELVKGDVVAIEADSPNSATWDAVGSRFILFRVSDTFD